MSRKKDASALSERTRAQYARTLERAFGKKAPTFVPKHDDWPESTRAILRAAIQSYWLEQGDEAKGILLARKISAGRRVERVAVFPTEEEAERFVKAGPKVVDGGCWAVIRLIVRHGLRSEEALAMPRARLQSAARYSKLTVLGKGSVERVLHVPQSKKLFDELLTTPRKGGGDWNVVGEILSARGGLDTQRQGLSECIRAVAREAGLDPSIWHPHTLRHVFADQMLNDGTSERELQAALGHKRLETLARYTHPRPERFSRKIRGE